MSAIKLAEVGFRDIVSLVVEKKLKVIGIIGMIHNNDHLSSRKDQIPTHQQLNEITAYKKIHA